MFLVLQPSYIILTVVCWYACLQLSGPSFILLSLCHWEPQEVIFSVGFVVKPLAAAALRVSFPSHWSWTDKEPQGGRGRLMCICKPTAASEGSCYLAASGAADLNHFVPRLKCIKCKSPAGGWGVGGGSGVLHCAQNWNETWLVSHHRISGRSHSVQQQGRRGRSCWEADI